MKRGNNKKLNLGFSLIELIVGLLVSSIVALGIGVLMSIGTNIYHSTSTEVELQKESQIAMNQINDLLIKAKYYDYRTISVDGVAIPTLVITGSEEGVAEVYYAVIHDVNKKQLLFRKISKTALTPPGDRDAWVADVVDDEIRSSTPSLLAKYIEEIKIDPVSSATNTEGIAQVTLKLSLDGKDYSTFSSISFRNK